MSAEKLKEEIFKETEATVNEILGKAREEAEKVIAEARERAKSIMEARKQEVLKKYADVERARLAMAKLEGRKLVLETETRLVEEAVKEARARLAKVERDDKYLDILVRLTCEAIENVGEGEVILYVNKEDIEFLNKRWDAFVSKVWEKHPKVSMKLSKEPTEIMGGVIVSSTDGLKIYNNSFDARLNRVIEGERGRIVSILLGEEA
ncbi:hypothetical protein B6U99_00245 [Candidatus Geothermarchaeota archaeon ex4572_27]|nr:MAG: hypothetical protein B6U99_00245 [Candidatus Geothermarchaeota archaeon ex4572_27]